MPHTYNPTIKGWAANKTPPADLPTAGINSTTTQTKLEQLKAENERLKLIVVIVQQHLNSLLTMLEEFK